MFSWRPTQRQILWTIGIVCLLVAFVVFVYLGYHLRWRWTGFPKKRLFDWIQILVIPFAVAIGTFALNRAAKRRDDVAQEEQRKREKAIETERAEEASLQAYLDYMSRMLTDPDRPLHRSRMGDSLSVVARAQTLTVLRRLGDKGRKTNVIDFLSEAGLISGNYPVIDLGGANLVGTNFLLADLSGAHLSYANLQEADLFRTNFQGANLQWAKLRYADLQGAELKGAKLHNAYIAEAKGLTQDQIEEANGDKYTILPEELDRPKSWSIYTDEHTKKDS